MSPASKMLSLEERQSCCEDLTAVWQALAQPSAAPAARRSGKGFRSSPEASELLRDIDARCAVLQAKPPVLPQGRSFQDELPSKLASRLCAAMSTGKAQKKRKAVAVTSAAGGQPKAQPKGIFSKAGSLLEYA